MPEFSQINVSTSSDGILPSRQDTFLESAALGFAGKEAACTVPNEPRNDQNSGERVKYLLKLVASLEASNMALLNKFNQAERELTALRQPAAQILPKAESNDAAEQSPGWERKLTRMG